MYISDLLKKEYIIEELKSGGKQDVLAELTGPFASANGNPGSGLMVRALLEREKLGSTAIGDGIAIPHAKLAGIDKILIGFGRSKGGVDFDSLDGRPAHLFFLLIAPETAAGVHLKVLAKISRMLKDSQFRSNLMEAKSVDDLYAIITEMDQRIF